jgi:hypothetical protein
MMMMVMGGVAEKAFATQHNLEVHSVIHSGRKPFQCAACGKAFARRAELRDHMRIHTGMYCTLHLALCTRYPVPTHLIQSKALGGLSISDDLDALLSKSASLITVIHIPPTLYLERVTETSQIFVRDVHVLLKLLSYEEHCIRDRW